MTTAFQYVFDNAASISIDRRAVTAQTITRDNTVRSISRGGQVWRFEVQLPDGPRWSELRPYIELIDYADRYTVGTVQINNPGYNSWLTPSLTGVTTTTGSWTAGSNTISTAVPLAVGDIIQLGTGHVYSMTSTTTVNRPVIDATGSGTITVGPGVTWSVICTDLPKWTVFARDQVSWSGPFVFYESLV
jgi:hypothetical protein